MGRTDMPRIRIKVEIDDTLDWAAPRGPTFFTFYLYDDRLQPRPFVGGGYSWSAARRKAQQRWFVRFAFDWQRRVGADNHNGTH